MKIESMGAVTVLLAALSSAAGGCSSDEQAPATTGGNGGSPAGGVGGSSIGGAGAVPSNGGSSGTGGSTGGTAGTGTGGSTGGTAGTGTGASAGVGTGGAAAGDGGSAPTTGGTGGSPAGGSGGAMTGGAGSGSGGMGKAGAGTGAVAGGGAAGTGAGGAGGATKSAGCGKATTLKSGMASIDVSGTMRQYTLSIPDGYDPNKPYKLIFGLHWLGGSMGDVVSGSIIGGPYYGLQSRAAGSAIFIAPNGIDNGWANTGGRDVALVKALVTLLEQNLCIDQARIFSTGFSYGGIFSLVLACEMSDVFRAIAPESGMFFSNCTTNGGHVAVWQSQGASDGTVQPDRAKAANDYFAMRNHCTMQSMPVDPSPCVTYQGCDPGYPVTWCEFTGGHTPWNMAPDPVWKFFSQF